MPITEAGFVDTVTVSAQDLLIQFGPTIGVDIGFDLNFDYSAIPFQKTPASSATQVLALVDTGASESCIDENLAIQLGLPLVDRQQIAGVSGAEERNVYLAHIITSELGNIQWGRFLGVSLAQGGQQHLALIGRNFLRDKLLIYDGRAGTVKIAV